MSDEIFQSIVLGVVQGLGEFLPISSTAHLILTPYFFGWRDPGLSFDVALHLGTLIAVLMFFYADWIVIFKSALNTIKRFNNFNDPEKIRQVENLPDKNSYTHISDRRYVYNEKLLWFLIIATIPGVLAGYFLEAKAETIFRSPLIIALTLSLIGLLLYVADKKAKKIKNLQSISRGEALIIGAAQALAIIPGVSRSGATITAGLFLGLDRTSAARFSFLLSTPIIFGAAILKIPELLQQGITVPIILGILTSAASGYLAIKYLLKFVEKSSYAIFFWYRLALAFIIVYYYFFG